MKEGSHKFPVGGPSLPRPELNPLTNPVLGRNLGRWAQVYFTSPPEKREQAVTDLLRELETEPALEQGQAAAPPHRAIDPSPVVSALREARDSVQPAVETAEIECEKCGHVTSTENRYCGFCGGPLGEVAGIDNQVGPPTDAAPIQIESDHELEWLRNKDLASFQVSQGRSLGWVKYAVALVAIAVAGFLYFQYGDRPSPAVQSSSPAVPNTAAQQTAQPARPERALPDPKNDKHLIQAASLKKEQPPAAPQPAASTDSDNRAALPSAGASDRRTPREDLA